MAGKKRPKKIVFPYDWLSKKDKKKYMEAGAIKVSNLLEKYTTLESLPSLMDLEGMNFELAKKIVQEARAKYKNAELKKKWGIKSDGSLYTKVFDKYEIQLLRESNRKGKGKKKEAPKVEKPKKEPEVQSAITSEATFRVNLKGIFTGKDGSDRVKALIQLLKENNAYEIYFDIQEKAAE